ncbi:M23 family metallopeptidase [Microbacterium sp. ASV49]|uniref:Peptidoglycan DD-metalloendopeptidase family protein n=1 Tax=Microbacterium candidum TaxID=3041922 RepID=A0ABT7N3I7_9MICO|nr:peptidoglycan DD-metalloendopeptidase family protein [Microbacterium sp. ASV49]MDL9981260.1 peptidoglycan DD-metalloendopeptidase family protein [Microbacterium sp. ASV49]
MPDQASTEAGGSRAETRRRSADAAPQRPAVVWGRAAETPRATDTVAISTAAIEAETVAIERPVTAEHTTTATERTNLIESAPQTTRRTRSTARAGVSTSGDVADVAAPSAHVAPATAAHAAPAKHAAPPSRSDSRRARTAEVEVPKIVRASVVPAASAPTVAAPAPEPVVELRQVITTSPIRLPEPAALAATPSISALPVVEVPKRSRVRPVTEPVSEQPVAGAASAPAVETSTASEPVLVAGASTAAEPAVHIEEPARTVPAFLAPEPVMAEPVVEAGASFTAPRDAAPHVEPASQPRAQQRPRTEPVVDEFEAAARLFSFTGETPIQQPAQEQAEPEPAAGHKHHKHKAPRKARAPKTGARRAATASFSIGVMGIVGLLTVGMTTPAEAVAAATGSVDTSAKTVLASSDATGGGDSAIQTYMAPEQAQAGALDRSVDYSAVTAAQAGQDAGIKNVSSAYFTNDPNSPIQWPFAVGCTISWGFGPRPGEFHEGVDFTPGAGAHIQAIADGVVRVSTDNGGGYGVMIIIDHIIDGKLISSRYGHMQYGSRQVQVGDHVHVGEYIGRTGNTGHSFGAHTHLEILVNGTTPIDPIPWLRAHVK